MKVVITVRTKELEFILNELKELGKDEFLKYIKTSFDVQLLILKQKHSTFFARLALESKYQDTSIAAIKLITDPAVLTNFIIKTEDENLKEAGLAHLVHLAIVKDDAVIIGN